MVTGSAPVNISKLLHVYTPSRTLRSSPDTRRFAINHCKRKQHGFRRFAHYGPPTWNDLPYDIRHRDTLSSIKNRLKLTSSLSATVEVRFLPPPLSLSLSLFLCACVRACACQIWMGRKTTSSTDVCVCVCAVSYTHLTLPTRRTV